MSRIRTIKPDFFTSEDICALSPWARLLYIATWLEADREGRLRFRPGSWRLRYFPSDPVDMDAVTAELVERGLLRPYGDGLAVIPAFTTHQVINGREAPSTLAEPPDQIIDAWGTRAHASGTRDDASGTREDAWGTRAHGNSLCTRSTERTAAKSSKSSKALEAADPLFDRFWSIYPRRVARQAAIKAWRQINPDQALTDTICEAVVRQSRRESWQRDNGIFIPHAATWIRGRRWEDVDDVATGVLPTSAATNAERARTVELLKHRETLLRGDLGADR